MTTRTRKPVLSKPQTKKVSDMIDRKINKVMSTKHVDIMLDSQTVTAGTGLFEPITNIIGGTEDFQRVGLEIRPTLIDFYFEWIIDATDATNVCRLSLIHWMDDDVENAPTLAKIFQDIANVRPFSAFKFANVGANRTFTVLFDRIYTVSKTGSQSKASRVKLFGRKLPNVISYNEKDETSGKNKVYLIGWSDSTVNGPNFKMHGKFSYKDA